MKLAIVSPFIYRYNRGIERFTWSLSSALAERDVEVDLFTIDWPRSMNRSSKNSSVQVRKAPYTRYFQYRAASIYYGSWLKREHYDWVMVFFAGYGEAEAIRTVSRRKKQSYCLVLHFPQQLVPHRYEEFLNSGLIAGADQVIAVSEYVASGARSIFGRDYTVIENGVDPEAFKPSQKDRLNIRKRMGVKEDTPVLITLAALEERKGVQWIIRAFPYLIKNFPGLQYWILGEGTFRKELESEIKALGLDNNIHLLGNVNDVIPYLAASDIGCLLSYGEAFPITMLEYLAMELPIITSNHPPFNELLNPEFGVTVNEKNSENVADVIFQFLLSSDRRQAMGRAGREYVLANNSWDKVAQSYLALLDT